MINNIDANKATVKNLLAAIESGADISQFFTADATWWVPEACALSGRFKLPELLGAMSQVFGLYKKPPQFDVDHITAEDNRVASVTARSPIFQTRQGIAVGSDVDAVLSHLGKEYEREGDDQKYVLHNWGQGWHVGVENNLVTYFQVTPPMIKD